LSANSESNRDFVKALYLAIFDAPITNQAPDFWEDYYTTLLDIGLTRTDFLNELLNLDTANLNYSDYIMSAGTPTPFSATNLSQIQAIVDFDKEHGVYVKDIWGHWAKLDPTITDKIKHSVIGDFNHSGQPDALVDFGISGGIKLYKDGDLNNSTTIKPPSTVTDADTISAMLVADYNGDNNTDLIVNFGVNYGVWAMVDIDDNLDDSIDLLLDNGWKSVTGTGYHDVDDMVAGNIDASLADEIILQVAIKS